MKKSKKSTVGKELKTILIQFILSLIISFVCIFLLTLPIFKEGFFEKDFFSKNILEVSFFGNINKILESPLLYLTPLVAFTCGAGVLYCIEESKELSISYYRIKEKVRNVLLCLLLCTMLSGMLLLIMYIIFNSSILIIGSFLSIGIAGFLSAINAKLEFNI